MNDKCVHGFWQTCSLNAFCVKAMQLHSQFGIDKTSVSLSECLKRFENVTSVLTDACYSNKKNCNVIVQYFRAK